MKPLEILIIGSDHSGPTSLKTQGQYLRDTLQQHGFKVKIASPYRNYIKRIVDTFLSLITVKSNSIVIIQVYSSMAIYLEFLAAFICQWRGVTVISTLHGGNIPFVYHKHSWLRKLLQLIFHYSNRITAPSAFIIKEIPDISDWQKCKVIHNVIDLNDYQIKNQPTEGIRIFWMRSYDDDYGPMLAVKIVHHLYQNGFDVKMIMAGSDLGLKKDVENYVSVNHLDQIISILGVIDNPTKNEIAAKSNVYLSTNKVDNAPVTFLEMMAMGIPVISTRVGGIPYYVNHRQNALLPEENTVEAIADLIILLKSQPELEQQLIQNGIEFVKEYGEEQVCKKWISLFEELGYFPAYFETNPNKIPCVELPV